MMQDFRDSQEYQIFNDCRVNSAKYESALDAVERSPVDDQSAAKRAAIEAMAFNESCMASARKIDITHAPGPLRATATEAFAAYQKRIEAENAALSAIITNQHGRAGELIVERYTIVGVETGRFHRLEIHPSKAVLSTTPEWVYIIAIGFALLVFRGLLRPRGAEDYAGKQPRRSYLRDSAEYIASLARGVYGDIKIIKTGFEKDKKDKENV